MQPAKRLEDLSAEQLRTVLECHVEGVTEGEAAAVHDFLEQIGGIENARAAIALLQRLEAAA